MLVLYTDTDCDVDLSTAKSWGYKGLISMPYTVEGKTIYPYSTYEPFDYTTFYNNLRNSDKIPVTSAVSEAEYIDIFRKEFEEGNDILYVHFSTAMTSSFNNMNNALKVLYKEFPDRKLYEIDTKGITAISYAIAEQVSILFKEGKSLSEILDWAKTEVDHWAMYFFVDDLKFFKKSGRVSGLSATMGTLLGIRPIIYMSKNGKMESIDKVKGQKNAISYLINKAKEIGSDVTSYKVYIGHTDAGEIVDKVKEELYKAFGSNLEIVSVLTNPTSGVHAGPNGLGVCFHSTQR